MPTYKVDYSKLIDSVYSSEYCKDLVSFYKGGLNGEIILNKL